MSLEAWTVTRHRSERAVRIWHNDCMERVTLPEAAATRDAVGWVQAVHRCPPLAGELLL